MGINELEKRINAMILNERDEDIHEQLVRNYINSIQERGYDTINKPKHYMLFEDKNIEVRDVISKLLEKMENSSYSFSALNYADYVQMMQYIMRFMDKNGKQDLEKAQFYLVKMIEQWNS